MAMRAKAQAMLRKAVSYVSRSFGLSDVEGAREALGGNNPSGQSVTVDSALQLSVIFAGVRLVAQTVATLPCLVYRKKNGGGREVDTGHPLYALLHDSPNADQTAVEFWEEVITYIALRGRAHILKTFDVTGTIIALTPLHPDRMGARRLLTNGTYIYPYNHPVRGLVEYSENEIWLQRGYLGLSVIQYGARSMGAAMASENAASKLFDNDMRPIAVLSRDEFFTKDQRRQFKEVVEDGMLQTRIGGNMRLIEGGTKYQQLSLTAEDAQLLETRQFSVEDLCRWIGVPPSMIGHGTAVSNWGTGREQINLSFLQYVLGAYTERLEQGITKNLLRPEERRRVYAEFSVEGLLRADSAGRATFYSTMVQNGIMTRNEVRELENWPTKEGGDDLTVQSNLIPVSLLGTANTSTDAINNLKQLLGIEEKSDAT
jgi:HK97 family phage portal protein